MASKTGNCDRCGRFAPLTWHPLRRMWFCFDCGQRYDDWPQEASEVPAVVRAFAAGAAVAAAAAGLLWWALQ